MITAIIIYYTFTADTCRLRLELRDFNPNRFLVKGLAAIALPMVISQEFNNQYRVVILNITS